MPSYWGSSKDADFKPKWQLIKISSNGIIVTYQEKYGKEIVVECIGLWYNDTQYKLTWKDAQTTILEKQNVNSVSAKEK